MARSRRYTAAAIVGGVGSLAGVLGTVAAVDGMGPALILLVFLMFCARVAALTALVLHPGSPLPSSALTKGKKR